MSLFKCEQCGCVENTACCGWVWDEERKQRVLICSECNPAIGFWHGFFEKVDADQAGYEPVPGSSRYIQRKQD